MTLPQIRSIADLAEAADGAAPLDEATWLALRHRPDEVTTVVEDAGFALLHDDQLSLAVAPEARGHGLGRRLAARALAGVTGPVSAWSHADHPAAARLAAHLGFARVRELWVMRRAGGDLPDRAAADGALVRGYRPADEAELLRVNAAAFAHHPEQGGMDASDLAERMAESWYDPADLLVAASAEDDSRLLGFHWTKVHDAGPDRGRGEVYVVGIDPAAQGRGLGKVLTAAGLRHLAERGAEEVLLYVEADNEPAVGLYSGLGFAHDPADTHVLYRRD